MLDEGDVFGVDHVLVLLGKVVAPSIGMEGSVRYTGVVDEGSVLGRIRARVRAKDRVRAAAKVRD